MQSMSFLIHGGAKVGKSSLGGTSPPPMLILDAEGSTKFLSLRFRPWRPQVEAAPHYDGTWDAAVVNVTEYADLEAAWHKLLTGQHHFRSLVFDSVTEGQRKLKQRIVGTAKMGRDNWDELLRNMDVLVRGFRDLTQHPTNPLLTATFICETRMDKDRGKYVPNLQGQISTNVPYWFDVCGYLWQEVYRGSDGAPLLDENGRQRKFTRLLTTSTHPMYEAGERVQGRLPDVIDNANIYQMLVTVFPSLVEASQQEAVT
jgi:hypothetical protein